MPRQYGKNLDSIREDHVERYELASESVSGTVLDAACGCGYGAFLMATYNPKIEHISALDVSNEALAYAKKHWYHDRVRFMKCDLNNVEVLGSFDWLVCFETIEHLEDPRPFLKLAAKCCKKIICSVPNEKVLPKKPHNFKHHFRHYTRNQVLDLLEECGWLVFDVGFQRNSEAHGISDDEGATIIIVGESRENYLLDETE